MKACDAIQADNFRNAFGAKAAFYRTKFDRLLDKTGLADAELPEDLPAIKSRMNRTLSFNLAGFLLGPFWGLYRRLPMTWVVIALTMVIGIAGEFLKIDMSSAAGISASCLFGFYGNSWLLNRYFTTVSEGNSPSLVLHHMRTSIGVSVGFAVILTLIISAGLVYPWLREGTVGEQSLAVDLDGIVGFDQIPTTASTESWHFASQVDPVTDHTIDSAFSVINAAPYRVEVEIRCQGGGYLSYHFTTLNADNQPTAIRSRYTDLGTLANYIIRIDSLPAKEFAAVASTYNNQINIGTGGIYNVGLGAAPRDLAKAQTITFRAQLLDGVATVKFDQKDEGLRQLLDSCNELEDDRDGGEPMDDYGDVDEPADPPGAELENALPIAGLANRLSEQVKRCFQYSDRDTSQPISVVLKITLNPDGTVAEPPVALEWRGVSDVNQERASRLEQAAIDAVQRCAPLNLPPQLYDRWKEIELVFNG